jgi:hypothetical protein
MEIIIGAGIDFHMRRAATNGFLKDAFETCLGAKTDGGAKVGRIIREVNLVDKGRKTRLCTFAQQEKSFYLVTSDREKLGIKNDVALIKEVVKMLDNTGCTIAFNNALDGKVIKTRLMLE